MAGDKEPIEEVLNDEELQDALQIFRPELAWIHNEVQAVTVIGDTQLDDPFTAAFWPLEELLRQGKFLEIGQMWKYLTSGQFVEALDRQMELWVPSSYRYFSETVRRASARAQYQVNSADRQDLFSHQIHLRAVIKWYAAALSETIAFTLSRVAPTMLSMATDLRKIHSENTMSILINGMILPVAKTYGHVGLYRELLASITRDPEDRKQLYTCAVQLGRGDLVGELEQFGTEQSTAIPGCSILGYSATLHLDNSGYLYHRYYPNNPNPVHCRLPVFASEETV
ncbi:hypothetical protein H4R33_007134 [Dimargaris cristalligena]|nr:hypothetical protein H4R33_007134 [Dimargaris cristalligena]